MGVPEVEIVHWLPLFGAAWLPLPMGFVYYTVIFVRPYMTAMNADKHDNKWVEKGDAKRSIPVKMAIDYANFFLQAFVAAHFLAYFNATTIVDALTVSTLAWAALIAPTRTADFLWEWRPTTVQVLACLKHWVCLSAQCVVLTLFPAIVRKF